MAGEKRCRERDEKGERDRGMEKAQEQMER